MPNADIDATVARLTQAVAETRARNPRLALFGALYRQTTVAVGRGVEAGAFDDGERMGRFVALFAGRYLEALRIVTAGGRPTRSWRMAFAAAERTDRVVLQHLILGINAHINLDLGVVAAQLAPGDAIAGLKDDFRRINDVLGRLAPPVQDCLGRFSPLLHVLFKVSGPKDDQVLNFSFKVARNEAWAQAVTLAHLDPAVVPLAIDVAGPEGLGPRQAGDRPGWRAGAGRRRRGVHRVERHRRHRRRPRRGGAAGAGLTAGPVSRRRSGPPPGLSCDRPVRRRRPAPGTGERRRAVDQRPGNPHAEEAESAGPHRAPTPPAVLPLPPVPALQPSSTSLQPARPCSTG